MYSSSFRFRGVVPPLVVLPFAGPIEWLYSKPFTTYTPPSMILARTVPVVDRRMQLALAAAAVVLLSRMALSLAIVPPWQQPDEPIHVAIAEVWRSRITGEGTSDRGREAEIIDSMIRHHWWRHYEKPLPAGPQPIDRKSVV